MSRVPLVLFAIVVFTLGTLADDVYEEGAAVAEMREVARMLPRPGAAPKPPLVYVFRRVLPDLGGKSREAWLVTHAEMAALLIADHQGMHIHWCWQRLGAEWELLDRLEQCPHQVHVGKYRGPQPGSGMLRIDREPVDQGPDLTMERMRVNQPPAELQLKGHTVELSKQICAGDRGCTVWHFEIDGMPLKMPGALATP